MRVNISYSVDLEQIPKEVLKLLSEAENIQENEIMNEFNELNILILQDKNYTSSVEKIDKMRLSLIKSIARLEDCSSILLSYIGVLNQQRQERHQQMALNFTDDLQAELDEIEREEEGEQKDE